MFDVRASALGDTSRKASHVPYRDSKLTRLLQVSKSQLFKILTLGCILRLLSTYIVPT
jgi:hypothetical protein